MKHGNKNNTIYFRYFLLLFEDLYTYTINTHTPRIRTKILKNNIEISKSLIVLLYLYLEKNSMICFNTRTRRE